MRAAATTGPETDDDLLEAAREKLGRGRCSASAGSDPGEKFKFIRLDVEEDLHRGRFCSLDPILVLQPEKPASDPCRLFLDRGLPLKSPSLREPRS